MRLTFLVAATAVVICGSAYGYCPQPTEPFCVDQRFTFEDEFRFRSCRGEMENYQAEVNGYLSCLKRASDSALNDYNAAVEKFNCRAHRGIGC